MFHAEGGPCHPDGSRGLRGVPRGCTVFEARSHPFAEFSLIATFLASPITFNHHAQRSKKEQHNQARR